MPTDLLYYGVAVPAVLLLGLSKGGFAGVGALSLPLMALAVSPVRAAAILLPVLIVQDIVGVWAFRRDWDGAVLAATLPGSAIGIGLAYAFASAVPVSAVLGAVGAISILFALHRLWLARKPVTVAGAGSPLWTGTIFGAASGFASQIAHAGGPPFQMWVMPRGLPPLRFAGTVAIFFAVTNWLKVPAFLALGQFTRPNLLASAMLMPVAILSTFAGVWLVRRVSAARFYRLINLLMVLVGARLLWSAF